MNFKQPKFLVYENPEFCELTVLVFQKLDNFEGVSHGKGQFFGISFKRKNWSTIELVINQTSMLGFFLTSFFETSKGVNSLKTIDLT